MLDRALKQSIVTFVVTAFKVLLKDAHQVLRIKGNFILVSNLW